MSKKNIVILGPDHLDMNESSDMSIIGAALGLGGQNVILLGLASDTSLAIERGLGDVDEEPEVRGYGLQNMENADIVVLYEDTELLERINDLGIIVRPNWVFLKDREALEKFADAAVTVLSRMHIHI